MIRLSGQVDYAFGNFPCLRGFAQLGVLADNTASDQSYQRNLDCEHLDSIRSFLANKEYTFFPEVILGTSLEKLGLDFDGQSAFREILTNPIGIASKKLSSILSIRLGQKLNNQAPRALTLNISIKQPCITRIDGNHRLEAVPTQQNDNLNIRSRIAPFCLVIFETEERYECFAPYFFHTINYRSLPIPKEKNLEIILRSKKRDGDYLFGDLMLKTDGALGMAYYFARKAAETIALESTPFIAQVLKENRLTFLLDFFELALRINELSDNETQLCKQLQRALILIDANLAASGNSIEVSTRVLIPMAYYLVHGQHKEFKQFISWIESNSLVQLSNANPEDIMTIFEHTHMRGPYKVFVAMPYVSYKRVNDFNKLFAEVLAELNTKGEDGIRYQLIPIMRFRGAAQRIDQRLIKCIRECDIFIADITGNNENVIFEVGLAEGANKPMLLIKEDDDKIMDKIFDKNEGCIKNNFHPPFDMDKLQYIPYSSTGYYNDIKGIVKRHLPVIVNELFESKIQTTK